MEPKAINHDLASRRDGLARIVGPKWGKLGAQRAPRVPDLQSLGRSSCRSGAWPGGFLQSDKASFLARVRLKCLGRKGNSSRKGALGSAGDPTRAGETESGGITTTTSVLTVLLRVAMSPALYFARSRTCPLPGPLFLRIWEVPRYTALQWWGSAGGGGDPDKAHSWEGRGEPRRCPHTASRICPPFLPFLSW